MKLEWLLIIFPHIVLKLRNKMWVAVFGCVSPLRGKLQRTNKAHVLPMPCRAHGCIRTPKCCIGKIFTLPFILSFLLKIWILPNVVHKNILQKFCFSKWCTKIFLLAYKYVVCMLTDYHWPIIMSTVLFVVSQSYPPTGGFPGRIHLSWDLSLRRKCWQ